jgi:hypothetical protein
MDRFAGRFPAPPFSGFLIQEVFIRRNDLDRPHPLCHQPPVEGQQAFLITSEKNKSTSCLVKALKQRLIAA